MKHPYNDIEGWFDMYETYQYLVDNTPNGGTIVEVGCWLGRSSTYLIDIALKSNKKLTIYFVDTWKGSQNELTTTHKLATEVDIFNIFVNNIKRTGLSTQNKVIVEIKQMSSQEFVTDDYINLFDTVFIDAEHTYDAVKKDISGFLPLVKEKGIISGHDYVKGWDGVIQAVDEAFGKDIVVQENCWIHVKK